ncbi:MFS transporter [Komagataeibacter sp. FNDCR2]|uniref:MFS transporter n=1 Tax=Komagataeibacter sp. FNDCR2 TaxID=2878682 RepID=UPI001E50C4A7|nr:MFS transporter [Komagataeibacter sp. FNDCR2]MCE2576468.1 MFS transporter [Komagataeibacter sp. FNDCR2]
MDGTTDMGNASTPTWRLLFSGANGAKSCVLAVGVALHAINLYMILAILPSAVKDIGGIRYYAWNETLFIVASIIGSSLSIHALGTLGPRRAYAMAAGVFALGALLCALAPSMGVMLWGRSFQGLGAGMLVSLAYAVIRLVFAEPLWTRAMGMLSSMWGIATLIGPAMGGLFAEIGAWRLAFWILCAGSLVFAIFAVRVLPPARAEAGMPTSAMAWRQLMLLVMSVLVLSVTSAALHFQQNLAGLAISLGLFAWFAHCEHNRDTRLLPKGALGLRSPLLPFYCLLGGLALSVEVIEIFAPLFLQVLHHQRPVVAGYLSALMAAGWSAGSFTSGGATPHQARRALATAPVLGFGAIVFLTWWMPCPASGSLADIIPIGVAFAAVGTGVGMAWPHLLGGILRLTPPAEQGLASASLTTIQLYTTAVASAVAGTIANAAGLAQPGGTTGAQQAAFWVFALFSVIPALSILVSRRVVALYRSLGTG